ncbi:MAG: flagellin [Desulfuromonadales bacterium]|nr:flagellin [Desulfuromonadales bacterium]
MALSDISLTAGMRSNLLQLQNTSKSIDRTQERLSTGKQVNSALDNPTNYFASQAALNRAADFSSRKDGMGEAIQTVKAADAGITAITALVSAAKGLAQAALGTQITADRNAFATQYNTLTSQINSLATDSQYKGTNLLNADNLSVAFNENASSALTVSGFTASTAGLSMATVATGGAGTAAWATNANISADQSLMDTAITTLRSQSKSLAGNLNIITTRQTYTDQMINTLQTGSDNLTLADMNNEGANMLMLQTRQSLGTTALSMSSQAAQSVLKLF